jgi:hypothetical protein
MSESRVLRRVLGPKRDKQQEVGENSIMRMFAKFSHSLTHSMVQDII